MLSWSVCVALAPGAWSVELPQFVDLGAEVDLPGLHGGPMVPVFLDVDVQMV